MLAHVYFTLRLHKSHHFFNIGDTAMPVSKHSMPKVNYLVINIDETATPLWG